MASNSPQPSSGTTSSHFLALSFSSPMLNQSRNDDDDDFQIPPSQVTETSQLKPLRPSTSSATRHRLSKKPKRDQNPGKENVRPGSDYSFSLTGPDSSDFGTQSCSLECIQSSIDYSRSDYENVDETDDADGAFECKEKLEAQKVYLCNSIEGRLLGRKLDLGFGSESCEEDGFVEEGSQLDHFLNLCCDARGGEDELREVGLVQCPLCGIEISGLSEEQRQVHTNDCLDKAEKQAEEHVSLGVLKIYPNKEEACNEEVVDNPVQPAKQAVDVSPVLKWLRNLGLAKYEDDFIREEIDWATLQWLTEEDLLSIGITALGPRKKIVHALSELRKGCPSDKDGPKEHGSKRTDATETQTERSRIRVNDPRKPTSCKLITEFFVGSDGKKVNKNTRNQVVSKKVLSDSGGRRGAKRDVRNGKLKDIPPWCCIPGTPFRVDAFRYLRGDCCHWFLTHFHMDHYQGLTRSFCHGKVYCSSVTAKLVNMKIGIPWDRLQVLPLNQKINIAGTDVTCFDANHCPGAIMILFEPPNGKVVLHTGDFRYSEVMASALDGYPIHTLILDTTYCNPQYDFPKQEAVVQFVLEAIQAEAFNPKTLFLIGSYTIGKERLFVEVARFLRKKVYVNAAKLRLLECLGYPKEDMQWLTVNEHESNIHVVPMWTLASFKRLKYVSNQYADRFSLIVAFSPTGWTFGKGKKKSPGRRWQQGTIIRYEVPYSEHSSFTELREFVKQLSPEKILPSVNNDGPDSAAAMLSLLLE